MQNENLLYNTKTFSDIYQSASDFLNDYKECGIPTTISDTNINTLFYLMYARYGNNPIANLDETQFKYKVFSTIFMYGGTWQKELEIQEELRALDIKSGELYEGTRTIHNHSFNPSTAPSTNTLDELTTIDDQSTMKVKKNKISALTDLMSLLKTDVTEIFLSKFKHCFKIFVSNEKPLLYETLEDNF